MVGSVDEKKRKKIRLETVLVVFPFLVFQGASAEFIRRCDTTSFIFHLFAWKINSSTSVHAELVITVSSQRENVTLLNLNYILGLKIMACNVGIGALI